MAYNNAAKIPNRPDLEQPLDPATAPQAPQLQPAANDRHFFPRQHSTAIAETPESQQDLAAAARFGDHRNPDYFPPNANSPSQNLQQHPLDPKNAPKAGGLIADALRKELALAGTDEQSATLILDEIQTKSSGNVTSAADAQRIVTQELDTIARDGFAYANVAPDENMPESATDIAQDSLRAYRGLPATMPPSSSIPASQGDNPQQQPALATIGNRRRRCDPALKSASSVAAPANMPPNAAPAAANADRFNNNQFNNKQQQQPAPASRHDLALTA